MRTWIYHPKLKRRVWVDFLGEDVRPKRFREFAQRILQHFDKLTDQFDVERARKVGGVGNWGTAKQYIEIMNRNQLLKPVCTEPKPAYIVSCTPVEELWALVESVGSRVAARRYYRVKTVTGTAQAFLKRQPILKLRENRPLLMLALEAVSRRLSW